jgi:hypothetical protein
MNTSYRPIVCWFRSSCCSVISVPPLLSETHHIHLTRLLLSSLRKHRDTPSRLLMEKTERVAPPKILFFQG